MMLKNEILNDPAGLGYSAMTDAQAATAISVVDRNINKRVPVELLLKYLGSIGKLGNFIEAKTDVNPTKRNPVLAIFSLFENPHVTDIDVAADPFGAGLDALVTESLITQVESDAITSMGKETVSRAQEIGAGKVYESTIRKVRN